MWKKILVIFLVLLTIILAGMLYLNKVFFPIQLKTIINEKSQELLHRRLSYAEIVFLPFKGIVIKDLIIYQKDDATAPFFRAEEVSAGILLPSFLKNFQIIIPSVTVRKPFLHLVRGPDGKWNYQDLLQPDARKGSEVNPVAIGGIVIEDGRAQISDRLTKTLSMEVWENINARAQLALTKSIKFDISLQNASQKVSVKAAGAYAFTTKDGNIQALIQNFNFAKYFNLFYTGTDIVINEGHIENAKILVSRRGDTAELHADLLAKADLSWVDPAPAQQPVASKSPGPVPVAATNAKNEQRHIGGRVNILNLNITQRNQNFEGSGQISGQDLLVNLGTDKIFQGGLETRNVTFSKQGKVMKAQGGFELSNFMAQWSPERSIKGNFSLKELQFSQEGDDLDFKVVAASPHLYADIDHTVIQGQLQSLEAVISRKNSELKGKANLVFNKFTAAIQGTRISGDLNVKNIEVSGPSENMQIVGLIEVNAPDVVSGNVFGRADTMLLPFKAALDKNQRLTSLADPVINNLTLQPQKETLIKAEQVTGQNFTAVVDDGSVQMRGQAVTKSLVVQLPGKQSFQGSPELSFSCQNNSDKKNAFEYQAQVSLSGAKFLGAPVVGDIEQITGVIKIMPDTVTTDELSFNTLGTAVTADGSVKDFAKPVADLSLSAKNVDLAKLKLFLNEQMERLALKATGTADIQAEFNGVIGNAQEAQIKATAHLHNATLQAKAIPGTVENINGMLHYSADHLAWENLKMTWQKNAYTLNGTLNKFTSPVIKLNVDSETLLLNADLAVSDKLITLSGFSGRFYDSAFDVTGKVLLKENAEPFLDLAGHVNLDLRDLAALNFSSDQQKNKLPVFGNVAADFKFKGQPKNYPKAIISIKVDSPEISINTFKFTGVAIDLTHGQSEFGKFKLTSSFYQGSLNIDGVTDSREQPAKFHLTGQLNGADLAAIKADNKFKGQNVSGLLNVSTELDGPMNNADLIHGKFAFEVANGVLMEMNFLKGLWQVLLVPELGDVRFTDAAGNFIVQDGKLATNDLFISGPQADLMATGSVDFKGNLDLDVTPKFKQIGILQSESMRKGPTAILTQGGFLNIAIKGTVQHPTYTINTSPGKIFKNTTGTIIEGVQDILDGILNQ